GGSGGQQREQPAARKFHRGSLLRIDDRRNRVIRCAPAARHRALTRLRRVHSFRELSWSLRIRLADRSQGPEVDVRQRGAPSGAKLFGAMVTFERQAANSVHLPLQGGGRRTQCVGRGSLSLCSPRTPSLSLPLAGGGKSARPARVRLPKLPGF